MATGTRALTLKLLADVDNFTKNLDKADKDVMSFGDKVSDFGKKAGLAFAAAGAAAVAYAGKLAIDGVKSAIAFVAKDSETGASFPAIQLNPAVEPPKFTDNGFTNSDKGGNSNSAICSSLTNEKQEIHTYVVIQKIKTVRDGKEVETSAHVINKGDEPTIDEAKTYTLPMACHCKLVELESWAVYTEQDELDGLGEEGQTYNQAAGYFSLSFVATAKSAAPRVYAVNN